MARRGFQRRFPPLEILTREDVEAIKRATLDILKETGLTIEHDEALRLLEDNDCLVDYETKRARFAEGLVEECLRRCPSTFRVKARHPDDDLVFGGNTVYFMSSPGMDTVDLDTWEPRRPTEQEYIDAVRVLDALENHDWFAGHAPYFGHDGVPEVMKISTSLAQRLRHTTKFLGQGHANFSWEWDVRLARAADTEIMIPSFQVASPLAMSHDTVECGFRSLEYGFPAGVDTGPLFGATAPATIAGALAQYNAELIAGIVLIQLRKPHTRTLVWGFPNALNMRSGQPAVGTIANSLFIVACNQIWRDYGVPLRNTASTYSKSKKIDFQNGFERAIPAMLSALSGASSVHLHGGMYGELSHSPIQSILDDDVAGMIGRFVEGVEVNEETVALELIHGVGPVPGQFLDSEHTARLWRKEQYVQEYTDSLGYAEWIAQGKPDTIDYAKKKMEEILATHEIKQRLTDEQLSEIDDILAEAQHFYTERGDIEASD